MQTQNRLLDDLARLASGALGVASNARQEAEALFRQRLQRLFDDMDLVPRDEFDAVREMAVKARSEQEALAKRVADLEARLVERPKRKATAKPAAKPAARGKSAGKSTTGKKGKT